jgi:hypothetical protein
MNVNCWARRPQTRRSPDPLATGRIPAPALRSYTTPEPEACDVALRVVRDPRTVRVPDTHTLRPTRLAITPSPPLLEVFARYNSPHHQPISAGCLLSIKSRARRPSRAVERILLAVCRRTCSPQTLHRPPSQGAAPPFHRFQVPRFPASRPSIDGSPPRCALVSPARRGSVSRSSKRKHDCPAGRGQLRGSVPIGDCKPIPHPRVRPRECKPARSRAPRPTPRHSAPLAPHPPGIRAS